MALPNQNAGPGKGLNGPSTGTRQRNTQTSNNGRNGGRPQLTSPGGLGEGYSSAAGIYGGLSQAWASLQNQLDASEEARKGLKAQRKTGRAAARSEALGAMVDAIQSGTEAGMTGSSQVAEARGGVLGQRRADIETVNNEYHQGVLASKVADQQAITTFQITDAQFKMEAMAQRQAAAIAAAQIAAQDRATAATNAYLNGLANPPLSDIKPGTTFMGRDVTAVKGKPGIYQVGGIQFDPTKTTESQIRNLIQNQLAMNTYAETHMGGRGGQGIIPTS